jgi:peptidoglycan hydrolase-like protein with peptidoglycan-binding domain
MLRKSIPICLLMALLVPATVIADDLTKMIQKDLIALGYDPGNIQGEMSTATVVAISKFQAENNMEVTGAATPQLAGIIKATLSNKNKLAGSSATAPATTGTQAAGSQQMNAETLQAAQQQCLQEKIAAKQKSQKKKKGFGSLMRAVSNTAARFGGNSDLARQVNETSYDIYNVNATAGDWEQAAEDLGLTQDELEECQNPQS